MELHVLLAEETDTMVTQILELDTNEIHPLVISVPHSLYAQNVIQLRLYSLTVHEEIHEIKMNI